MTEFTDEIRQIVGRLEGAWNEHDMKAFSACFLQDAQFVNVVGMWWRDRSEIEAGHLRAHATMFRDSVLHLSLSGAKLLKSDVALTHCEWDMTGQRSPDGSSLPPRKGIMSMVLMRGPDGWLIAALQNTNKMDMPFPR
jgi:uncharacterized protein (TIGR02246 family)